MNDLIRYALVIVDCETHFITEKLDGPFKKQLNESKYQDAFLYAKYIDYLKYHRRFSKQRQ